ncbi:MAG: YdcH family protein [Hyphomicrobiaceae bacterium]
MDSGHESKFRERLAELRTEHRQLDMAVVELELSGTPDQLKITRLKKQKLALRDEIALLENRLFPDIIA